MNCITRKIANSLSKVPFVRYYMISHRAEKLVDADSLDFPIWGEGTVKENIEEALHLLSLHGVYDTKDKKIVKSMVRDYLYWNVTPKEFVLFKFQEKSYEEKKMFLPDQLKDKLSINATGLNYFKSDLQDKYHFYELLSSFFLRQVMKLDALTSFSQFDSFCKKEKNVFIKPLNSSYGRGACKFEYNEADIEQLYSSFLSDKRSSYIVEGLIVQSSKIAAFNVSSVNTVRLPTILNETGFHVLGPFIRTGRAGSIVDNGGNGGIFSAIDIKTGRIQSDGMDENGFTYKEHPDSHVKFKGFEIPEWNNLLGLAEKAHRQILSGGGKHRYVAWDFAYTDDGWILIEGNWGQFLSQFVTGVGLKKEFEELMEDNNAI